MESSPSCFYLFSCGKYRVYASSFKDGGLRMASWSLSKPMSDNEFPSSSKASFSSLKKGRAFIKKKQKNTPTSPIMQCNKSFIRPSLPDKHPHLSNSILPFCDSGFLLNLSKTPHWDNADDIIMTWSGLFSHYVTSFTWLKVLFIMSKLIFICKISVLYCFFFPVQFISVLPSFPSH